MKKIKNIFIFIFSLILIMACCVTVNAANTPKISLSNVTAASGETVKIDINITDNPGIMAMTFSITYDSNNFEHISDTNGFISSSYTIKNHPDKGHLIFVNVESKDIATNGVILSLEFKVKDNAAPGKHTITLANQDREKYGKNLHNSFCNSALDYIIPVVSAGSITVPETCENSGHKYGAWNIIADADCTNTGLKKHICQRCNFSEEAIIPITHDFEDEWTVDKVATPQEDGIMSRHCKKCTAVTDVITFTYKEVEDSQNPEDTPSDENSSDDEESSNEQGASSDDTLSEGASSSQDSSDVSDTTTSTTSKPSSSQNKTPINNTIGSKNPLSSVENIKDYQENIKPNTNDSSNQNITNNIKPESTPSESDDDVTIGTTSSITSQQSDDDNVVSDDVSATDIITYIICAVLSIGIIVLAIILIIRRQKSEKP